MQTLYEVDPAADFGTDTDGSVLARRPELAVLVARIIAAWSGVDGLIGLCATSLLTARSGVAEAVYQVLSESGIQYAALHAAAAHALSAEDAQLFSAALKAVRKLGQGRHRFAHGIIAESSAVPDGLVLIEIRDFVEMQRVFFIPPRHGESRKDQVGRMMGDMARRATVFTKEDLEVVLRDIDTASGIALDATVLAAPGHHDIARARARLVAKLEEIA